MGAEAACNARVGRKTYAGTAQLEGEEILFRGETRLKIPLSAIKSLSTRDGWLIVEHADGRTDFSLGEQAEKWLKKIQNPKTLLDKLGVKPGQRVALQGITEEAFLVQLRALQPVELALPAAKGLDWIFFGVEAKEHLRGLEGLDAFLAKAGAVWIVFPKGQQHLKSSDVMAAGKAAGLVDTKVVKFSETHSALKFVIPISRR